MSFWPEDTAGKIADVLAVASVAITFWLADTANKVKKRYLEKVLLPDHLRDLEEHCQNLELYRPEYAVSIVAIAVEVGRVEGTLVALRRDLKKDELAVLSEVERAIAVYHSARSEANLVEVLSRMNKLMQLISNRVRGLPWDA